MANHQERQGEPCVSIGDGPPEQVPDHWVVLILPSAIVRMEEYFHLPCTHTKFNGLVKQT